MWSMKTRRFLDGFGDTIKEMEETFDELDKTLASWRGPVTRSEVKGEVLLYHFDLPGFEKKDIELSTENGVLSLRAKRSLPNNGKEEYAQDYKLLPMVDSKTIEATLKNGVLTVSFKKVRAEVSAKKVEIKGD